MNAAEKQQQSPKHVVVSLEHIRGGGERRVNVRKDERRVNVRKDRGDLFLAISIMARTFKIQGPRAEFPMLVCRFRLRSNFN
jgi:hypothetical protein